MPAIEIQSMVYDVYADVAEADVYMQGAYPNTVWFASTEDAKKQALVASTRTIDRQCWLGVQTGLSDQVLQWPRKDTNIAGVNDDIVPENIVNGSIELANLIINGSNVQDTTQPNAQTLQVIKAGSVSLTYFRPGPDNFSQLARFPTIVQELVSQYMCGSVPAVVGVATGTGDCSPGTKSVTKRKYSYNDGL